MVSGGTWAWANEKRGERGEDGGEQTADIREEGQMSLRAAQQTTPANRNIKRWTKGKRNGEEGKKIWGRRKKSYQKRFVT